MEPEALLPYSQPSTRTYPEPDRSSPYPTSHFLKIHLNIIYYTIDSTVLFNNNCLFEGLMMAELPKLVA
jgi:hypothetical protein